MQILIPFLERNRRRKIRLSHWLTGNCILVSGLEYEWVCRCVTSILVKDINVIKNWCICIAIQQSSCKSSERELKTLILSIHDVQALELDTVFLNTEYI